MSYMRLFATKHVQIEEIFLLEIYRRAQNKKKQSTLVEAVNFL